ncbi:TetR/AcrR family transcriptional regulator [Streptomyces sp. SID6673]|nr:TetR/AcrR family transcriptional regulator [Streptomyces sp. SID11726]NEB26099.1 TetR/AcrR family transcriptional regulator [Streptomyces sp. SID6673]
MPTDATPSARESELLEAAYEYVLRHGLTDFSLRPLAAAIGSSPRVLLYLFESKDGLIRAILTRARRDELQLLTGLHDLEPTDETLTEVARQIWSWLAAPEHRPVLALWVEAYARSLIDPDGPWARFAADTVDDWLTVLASAQPVPGTREAANRRTGVLAVLRGALLDLLATGDTERTTAAAYAALDRIAAP